MVLGRCDKRCRESVRVTKGRELLARLVRGSGESGRDEEQEAKLREVMDDGAERYGWMDLMIHEHIALIPCES